MIAGEDGAVKEDIKHWRCLLPALYTAAIGGWPGSAGSDEIV